MAADINPPSRRAGIGMIGHAFMGTAHATALDRVARLAPGIPVRRAILAGRDLERATAAAVACGFERATDDWRHVVGDDAVTIVVDAAPNWLHARTMTAAAQAGKHLFCEKPLALSAADAHAMWAAAERQGVHHMCGFNYRFVPALRLAWEMLRAGELGEIRHFRARYLQEWLIPPEVPLVWRLDREQAGSGALADLGSHAVDLARHLVGEIDAVAARTRTFTEERAGGRVTVDDAVAAVVEFESGAIGTIEASRMALGRKNSLILEINGSKGSLAFDLERMNELHVELRPRSGARVAGFQRVLVTEADHPFMEHWWPPGLVLGWDHVLVHQWLHLLSAIDDVRPIAPHGATFEDGYRAALVCDAIIASAVGGARETVPSPRPAGATPVGSSEAGA